MMTSKVIYQGDLRTVSTHISSNESIISDAPIDNNGKGAAFSPTDMVANALASCMFTVMAIKAKSMNVNFVGSTAHVTKIMGIDPRRIIEVQILFFMKGMFDTKTKIILENTAMNCPVLHSLNPEIKKNIHFNWT
jgi:uncharacterized OsmC-like protein